MIKRFISLLLVISMLITASPAVFAAENFQYGSLTIHMVNDAEEKDIPVMIRKGYLYTDAETIAQLLGYSCEVNSDNIVFLANRQKGVFLSNDNKVAYHNYSGKVQNYKLPCKYIINDAGAWVPMQYMLYLLGSYAFVDGNNVYIQSPEVDVFEMYYTFVSHSSTSGNLLWFDIVKEFGASEAFAVANREVNLLSGLLDLEPSSIVTVVSQYFGDWSAFEARFGDTIAVLFASKAEDELRNMIDDGTGIYNLVSNKGDLATSIDDMDEFYDQELVYWTRYRDYLKMNNPTYASYSNALDKVDDIIKRQGVWNDISSPMKEVQKNFHSTDAISDGLTMLNATINAYCYYSELKNADEASIEALDRFVKYSNSANTVSSKGGIKALDTYVKATQQSDEVQAVYSTARAFASDLLGITEVFANVNGFNLSQRLLGTQGSLALVVWNLAKTFVPFINDGLDRAEYSDISIYAQLMQSDAYLWVLSTVSASANDPSNEKLQQECAYSIYSYLKFSYIARSAGIAAIKTLPSADAEGAELIDTAERKNAIIAKLLPYFLEAASGENPAAFGFTPSLEQKVKKTYDDSVLIELCKIEEESHQQNEPSNEETQMIESYADTIMSMAQMDRFWSICDVDSNGTPELLFGDMYTLSSDDHPNVAHTYNNGLKALCETKGSAFWYVPDAHLLISLDGHGTGVGNYYVYSYDEDGLSVKYDIEYSVPGGFPAEYYKNGTAISEDEFNDIIAINCVDEYLVERYDCFIRDDIVAILKSLLGINVPPSSQVDYEANINIEPPVTTQTTINTTNSYYPKSVDINSDLQYQLNIFLSNYSEAYMNSFDGKPDSIDLVWFGMLHNHLNKYEKTYENVDVIIDDVNYFERIHKKHVAEAVVKYFGIELTEEDYRMASEVFPYKDSYLYFEWTGGWLSAGFSIVDKLSLVDHNTYEIHFCIYDDMYWFGYDGLYRMTPSDVADAKDKAEKGLSERYVSKIGEGTARIYTEDINTRSKYKILSYSVDRSW